jgi:hypothetical protein
MNNIMNNPDYRAELQDLYTSIQLYTGLNPAAADVHPAELTRRLMDAMAASAAALAQPKPVAPTDEEILSLADDCGLDHDWECTAEEILTFARTIQQRSTPSAIEPVPVSERPWERKGWCDAEGQCWMGDPGGAGFIPSWRLCRPEDAPSMTCSLPANALPTPEATND